MDELIVVYREESIEASAISLAPALLARNNIDHLAAVAGISLTPIFSKVTSTADIDIEPAELEAACYSSALMPKEEADKLAARLRDLPEIEAAYVRRQPENPVAPYDERDRHYTAISTEALSGNDIPDFRRGQEYLARSPGGVDAISAWQKPGGRGDGVGIIDIEGGWCLTHVDLQPNEGLLAGEDLPGNLWRDHGTAVLGVLAGTDGNTGITGIAPAARVGAISHGGIGAARAIDAATEKLGLGDIMLLEMHDAGPRFNYDRRDDQRGFIAMEWWPEIFIAIRRAVARGIVVVEAGGNGAESLDDHLYETPHPHFPSNWRNPFSGKHDSGAIIVGAGAPPNGMFGPDRSRLDFSNFGSRIDCQGWGRSVVTTGYGNLFAGTSEQQRFTGTFSGTSSASPVVAASIACLQGAARHAGQPLLPAQVRYLLRATGAQQQSGPSGPSTQHIGTRPNLAELFQHAGL